MYHTYENQTVQGEGCTINIGQQHGQLCSWGTSYHIITSATWGASPNMQVFSSTEVLCKGLSYQP